MPTGPATQKERGTAGDVDHAAVERVRHRASRDPVIHRRRIDPVLSHFGVDQQHGDGRVTLRRVVDRATVVGGQPVADLLAQRLSERMAYSPR